MKSALIALAAVTILYSGGDRFSAQAGEDTLQATKPRPVSQTQSRGSAGSEEQTRRIGTAEPGREGAFTHTFNFGIDLSPAGTCPNPDDYYPGC